MATDGNLSDEISSAIIAQTVNIIRAAAGLSRPVLAAIEDLEKELVADLRDIVGKSDFTVARMKTLLAQARETIAAAYGGIAVANQAGMTKVAEVAARQSLGAINDAIGVKLTSVDWTLEQLEAIANNTVVRGNFYEDWWKKQGDDTRARFEREMRMGQLRGETVDQLAARIRGTKAMDYKDGVMAVSRAQAQALVRTSALGVSNAARMAAYAKNDQVIKGVQWLSTLDNRTTPQCIALDGKRWNFPDGNGNADYADYKPIGHDKKFEVPPIHWNCRSTIIPITYSWKELAGEHGNSKAAQIADRVPRETRASMDGQVARTKTFESWLGTKPKEFQDEVLGVARAEAWRRGELKLTQLTDQNNNPLTLAQLGIALAPKLPPAGVPVMAMPDIQSQLQQAVDEAAAKLREAQAKLPPESAPEWIPPTEPPPPPTPAPVAPPPKPGEPPRTFTAEPKKGLKADLQRATPQAIDYNATGSGGDSTTYRITYGDGSKAIWKPLKSEATDIRQTVRNGTGFHRETAASDIADMIGLSDLVPPTITTEYEGLNALPTGSRVYNFGDMKPGLAKKVNGAGSAQAFVDGATPAKMIIGPSKYGGSLLDIQRSAAFDFLIGNTDRHGGNWLVVYNGAKIQLIDHGLSFPRDSFEFGSRLFEQALSPHLDIIPAEVKAWADKWPEIKDYLEHHGFDAIEVALTELRIMALRKYDRFTELATALYSDEFSIKRVKDLLR